MSITQAAPTTKRSSSSNDNRSFLAENYVVETTRGSGSTSSGREITARAHFSNYTHSNSTSEIEEEEGDGSGEAASYSMAAIKEADEDFDGSCLFSLDFNNNNNWEDCVYVAIGKSDSRSCMDALCWALKNLVSSSSTVVYLLHVFPETHHVPTPLGKLPRNQVSPRQIESYLAQERSKRRELLQKYIAACSAAKVKVDTMLIESDMVAKAIIDLIPILNIRRLVIGTTKSRRSRARRGSAVTDQILQNAKEFCEVKIICEGKDVTNQTTGSPKSPSPSPRNISYSGSKNADDDSGTIQGVGDQRNGSSSCISLTKCFK